MERRDDELWERADTVLDQLLDLPADAREPALRAMRLPRELEGCVRRLLSAHGGVGTLDRPPSDMSWSEPSVLAGRRFGEWVLQHELGRGGMAVVWQARRSNGTSERLAAIKLFPVGALARHELTRFQREQAILGRLSHPHIAHLYEAGEAEDGTPYLAMEKVDGERIDAWCDRRGLDAAARVRLVLHVCAAIAYAHRNLVVHADLKPSNVLVDDQGLVRVLDFGIGRLLDERFADMTATLARAVTPEYAAPEQLAGDPATVAADVFGLGALLHRLLTGVGPREHDRDGVHAPPSRILRNRLREGLPAHGLRPQALQGDLDTIVLKALRGEPEQRYGSVDALQADLRAWLDQMPISARAPSRRYLMGKFMRRNRLALLAGAIVLVAVLAGLATTMWQARQARMQAVRATAVKNFLVDILDASDPTRVDGRDPRASELLRQGAQRIRSRLEQSPRVRAELLMVIGRSQLARGQLKDAQQSLDAALALFDRHEVVGEVPIHARALAERGMLDYEQGLYTQALRHLQQADAMVDPDVPGEVALRDGIRAKLADIQVVSGQPEAAMRTAGDLLAAMRRGGRTGSPDYSYALRVMGGAHSELHHYRQAIHWLEQARAALVGSRDMVDLAMTDNELGIAYDGLGREVEAAHALSSAYAIQVKVYGPNHPTPLSTLGNLASIHYRQGLAARAAGEFAHLIEVQHTILGDAPHPEVAVNLGWLALARYRAGDTDAAWVSAQQALAMTHALSPADRVDLDWIGTLNGLLAWESGHRQFLGMLDAGGQSCNDLEGSNSLERWACIARAWREADAGHCRVPAGKLPAVAPKDRVERRWQAAWHLLRARCGAADRRSAEWRAARALEPPPPARFPAWLRARMDAARPSS